MRTLSSRIQIIGLLAWLAVCFAAAGIGAVASVQAGAFYAQLQRPGWAPPAAVFGPVWTVLFALMGIAAWLAWRERGFAGARSALKLFLAQLAVNALWSWLFFAWHLGGAAFFDILLLWLLIVATIAGFRRIRPLAAVMMAPYLAWVSFAAALNFAVWQMNPGLLG